MIFAFFAGFTCILQNIYILVVKGTLRRVESGELRVKMWSVRLADTFLLYCDVGRGDPTPPGSFAIAAKQQGGVKTPPYITNP